MIYIYILYIYYAPGCILYRECTAGFSIAGSKFLSIMYRARMVSAGDNGVYTGSGLQGVIPYVQRATAVFLSQVCS
jgi:hypothetical protein